VYGLEFHVAQSSCVKRLYDVDAQLIFMESVSGSFFSAATTAPATFSGVRAGLHILAAISCTDTLPHTKDGAAG
jgi:hypothetical protein